MPPKKPELHPVAGWLRKILPRLSLRGAERMLRDVAIHSPKPIVYTSAGIWHQARCRGEAYDSPRAALRAVARLYGAAALLPLPEHLQLKPFTDDIVFFRGVDSHVIFAAARQIFLGMTVGKILRNQPDRLAPANSPICHCEERATPATWQSNPPSYRL